MTKDVIAIILGGGRGERLYPLTKSRAKPAVPIAGKFRLIDIPISNCLHSDLDRIFVLTQFNSTSLNRHIVSTYRFDTFSHGYVQILAAQQTQDNMDWYQGTADAVRQNLRRFEETPCHCALVLAGDHLYRMDYRNMIRQHIEKDAEITVAVTPVKWDIVKELGILKVHQDNRITDFVEKPQQENEISQLQVEEGTFEQNGISPLERTHIASMGIYIFNRDTLAELLKDKSMLDFGKHVIPCAIGKKRIYAHFFGGYWRDIGTIRSFYEAHMELTQIVPKFDFYNESAPVYTRPRYLPGSKINSCNVERSIICDGTIMTGAEIRDSIISIRSVLRPNTRILGSIIMGADYFESMEEQRINMDNGIPSIGIGEDSVVQNAIIDQNARIGRNVKIINEQNMQNHNGEYFSIRDGIVVVHKNAVISDNTVI